MDKKGITQVGDIVDSTGTIISLELLQSKYDLNINFLEYHRIKLLVKKLILKYKKNDAFSHPRPSLPFHLSIINKSKRGSRDLYSAFMGKDNPTPNYVAK